MARTAETESDARGMVAWLRKRHTADRARGQDRPHSLSLPVGNDGGGRGALRSGRRDIGKAIARPFVGAAAYAAGLAAAGALTTATAPDAWASSALMSAALVVALSATGAAASTLALSVVVASRSRSSLFSLLC